MPPVEGVLAGDDCVSDNLVHLFQRQRLSEIQGIVAA